MIFFGHIGITAGVSRACEICLSLSKSKNIQEDNSNSGITATAGKKRFCLFRLVNEIRDRLGQIDYRMVIIGSILPDIIDKPIFLLFGDMVTLSGRGHAHTLLFNLILLVIGLVLLKYRKSLLLVISLSSLMHLILDRIWEIPAVLFWPLLGPLPGGETEEWISRIWYSIFTVPEAYIPEIIGLIIIAVFIYYLIRNRRVKQFIVSGIID